MIGKDGFVSIDIKYFRSIDKSDHQMHIKILYLEI